MISLKWMFTNKKMDYGEDERRKEWQRRCGLSCFTQKQIRLILEQTS